MKKSLVLAMAMALGVTASAYAANPFSDVPAGHWAYDSLAKLASTGVIDGYPDGSFKGDETITRYEAAQITARAMAKGANVDKLAAEFSDELQALGVKVAALEKNADNVKIDGEIRYHYRQSDLGGGEEHEFRTRLWLNGQINDDWSYTGMVQNVQSFKDNAGNDDTTMKRAYINGKVGGLYVQGGRWNEVVGTGNILDETLDGLRVEYGNKVKVSAMVAKGLEGYSDSVDEDDNPVINQDINRLYVVGLSSTIGVVDVYANYFKAQGDADKKIYNLGVELPVAEDLTFGAEYMKASVDNDNKTAGYALSLGYKGAEADQPGTWGVHAQYLYQPANVYITPTTDANTFDGSYKGWNIGAEYTFAKNIVGSINYYNTKSFEVDEEESDKVIFSELYFYF